MHIHSRTLHDHIIDSNEHVYPPRARAYTHTYTHTHTHTHTHAHTRNTTSHRTLDTLRSGNFTTVTQSILDKIPPRDQKCTYVYDR